MRGDPLATDQSQPTSHRYLAFYHLAPRTLPPPYWRNQHHHHHVYKLIEYCTISTRGSKKQKPFHSSVTVRQVVAYFCHCGVYKLYSHSVLLAFDFTDIRPHLLLDVLVILDFPANYWMFFQEDIRNWLLLSIKFGFIIKTLITQAISYEQTCQQHTTT